MRVLRCGLAFGFLDRVGSILGLDLIEVSLPLLLYKHLSVGFFPQSWPGVGQFPLNIFQSPNDLCHLTIRHERLVSRRIPASFLILVAQSRQVCALSGLYSLDLQS